MGNMSFYEIRMNLSLLANLRNSSLQIHFGEPMRPTFTPVYHRPVIDQWKTICLILLVDSKNLRSKPFIIHFGDGNSVHLLKATMHVSHRMQNHKVEYETGLAAQKFSLERQKIVIGVLCVCAE